MQNSEKDRVEALLDHFEVEELEQRLEFAEWGICCQPIIDPSTGQTIGEQCGVCIGI